MSVRRLVENELIFRQSNERVAKGFINLKHVAAAEAADWLPDVNAPFLFYCECSNMNCRERIKLKPEVYLKLHKNRSQFVILPGHALPEIERTVRSDKKFVVVEKFIAPVK